MTTIPEGYDLIAEGICTFTDSPKTVLGFWYLNEEVNIYYFLLAKDSDDEGEGEMEIYPVEEENMVYDDHEVFGWFSKTMENYTFVDLPESESDEEDEGAPAEGSFWQSFQGVNEEDDIPVDEEDDYIPVDYDREEDN